MQLLQKNPMANLVWLDYVEMIKPTVIDWYISEYTPKPAWMQATKAHCYLPRILVELLIKIDDMLEGIEIYDFLKYEIND